MVKPILLRETEHRELLSPERSQAECWALLLLVCLSFVLICFLPAVQQEHLLQMEVSLLRLSSRGLDKRKTQKKRNGWNPPMISWRRGTLAISQCLALNLHTVLTALVIWFLRWQIRNSKLQVGRLLVAGLWKQKTADRKAGKHMCEPLLRAVFLVLLEDGHPKKCWNRFPCSGSS